MAETTRAAWPTAGRAPERLAMNCSGEHGLRRLGVPADRLAPWSPAPVSGGDGVVGEVRPSEALTAEAGVRRLTPLR